MIVSPYASCITDAVSAANTQSFTYDALDRLYTAAATGTGGYGSYSWTYDKIGNRLSETLGSALTSYTYSGPRLSKVTAGSAVQTFGYTGNGNIATITPTTGGVTNYAYNNANRVSSASVPQGTVETFTDDAFGQQILRTGPGGSPVINRYSYDQAGHLLAESVNGSGTSIAPVTDYIWLGDRPVAAVTASGGTISFLQGDRLNTPVMATSATQAIVWSASYLPFGQLYTQGGTINQNLRLPGQIADPSALANWSHNGARTYLPWAGRYLESDPIGLGGGVNTYGYALQNPFKYVDPRGTQVQFVLPFVEWAIEEAAQMAAEIAADESGSAAAAAGEGEAAQAAATGAAGAAAEAAPSPETESAPDSQCKTYQTYTKTNQQTNQVYSGRTSGTGSPNQNVYDRDLYHHMNDQGYGPARLDSSSNNPDAIRGREQQLIDQNGGAQSMGGNSANKINAVSPRNPNAPRYFNSSNNEFAQ